MTENEIIDALAQTGLENAGRNTVTWRDAATLLSALDVIARDGGNAIIKVDGGRNDGQPYTVVLSGGRLGQDFYRRDGADLNTLLADAIAFYIAHRIARG